LFAYSKPEAEPCQIADFNRYHLSEIGSTANDEPQSTSLNLGWIEFSVSRSFFRGMIIGHPTRTKLLRSK
jgi:hypothetical protein